MERMESHVATSIHTQAAHPVTCPICGKAAPADQFGFVECACGWGGPGDPVESSRGAARWFTLLDRRLAAAVTRRELARIARAKTVFSGRHLIYSGALLLLSTLIYFIVGALFVGSVILCAQYLMARLWVGAVLDIVVVLYLYWTLFGIPHRAKGIVAPLSDYPQLEAMLGEVAARVGVKTPRWVMLSPAANFSVSRRMLWGRALMPQVIVSIGAPCLALLNDCELRAILAHELAHYQREHTFSSRYFGGAEEALYSIIDGMNAGISTNFNQAGRRYYRRYSTTSLAMIFGVGIVWVLTLPLRLLWFIFHLTRLRMSRAAEYEADATACEAYGADAFINGLTALQATGATMRGASQGIRQEMAKRNNPSYFAELRRHYAELPTEYLGQMRMKAAQGYRTLESSHPITPDRIRAALLLGAPEPADAGTPQPAYDIITPAGAPDASGVERQLTDILFAAGRQRSR